VPKTFRVVAASLSAAAVLALSGCGGDDPLSGASSTPKASEVTVDVPEAARKHTADGSVEFTKFYFDKINEAFSTGEYAPLVKLSHSDCTVCRQTVGDVAFAFSRGKMSGGKITLESVKSLNTADKINAVAFVYKKEPYSELDSSGNTLLSKEAVSIPFVVQTEWTGDSWVMRQLIYNSKGTDDSTKD
jgi:hypothetical protein